MGCIKTNNHYKIGVFITTFLVITAFLCQNVAWAGFSWASEKANGPQYKLASDTNLDKDKFTATSEILGSVLEKMYETIRTYKSGDPQQIELNTTNPNLRLIYNPAQKCFYLYSKKPSRGPGVVYRMSLSEVRKDPIIGDNNPFHEDTIGKFTVAIFTSTDEIKERLAKLETPPDNGGKGGRTGILGTVLFVLIPIIAVVSPALALALAVFAGSNAIAQESPVPNLLRNPPGISMDGSDIQHPPLVLLEQMEEQPQWIKDMDRALESFNRRYGKGKAVYGGEASFDSNIGGGLLFGTAERGKWSGNGLLFLGYPSDNIGGIGTAHLRMRDNLLLSSRFGILPYSPDTTGFGLLGADYLLEKGRISAQAYGRLGGVYKWLGGEIEGSTGGLLVDTGLSLTTELWDYRRLLALDFGFSGPVLFGLDTSRAQVQAYHAYQRIFRSPLSLARVRLNYTEPFPWGELIVKGGLQGGGFENIRNNRFYRAGLAAELKRNNPFGIPMALLLGSGYERVSPLDSPETRGVSEVSMGGEWGDLSGVIGITMGPSILPYAEARYELLKNLLLTGGLNRLSPIYDGAFYEGPFQPRPWTIFSVGLRYVPGAGYEVVPPVEHSVLNNPYPVEGYGLRYAYGPVPVKTKQLEKQYDADFERFRRSISAVVANAKSMDEVKEVFEVLSERSRDNDEEGEIFYSICWGSFWDAFYSNPNIALSWMDDVRDISSLSEGETIYERFLSGIGPSALLTRLVDKELEIRGQDELGQLMSEFDELMETLEAQGGWNKNLLDTIQTLFQKYMHRLENSSPDTEEGIFNYYVASKMFSKLVEHGRYPGLSPLLKLIEFRLTMSPPSVDVPMVSVPDETIVKGLASMIKDTQEGIMSHESTKQIQGMRLIKYFIITDSARDYFTTREWQEIVNRIVVIFEVPYSRLKPPEEKEEMSAEDIARMLPLVPLVPTEKSEPEKPKERKVSQKEMEAARLAYEILLELDLKELINPEAEGFLLDEGTQHDEEGGKNKDASIPVLPLFPLMPGMVNWKSDMTDEKIVKTLIAAVESAGDKKIILALDMAVVSNVNEYVGPLWSKLDRLVKLKGNITFIRGEGSELKGKIDRIKDKDKARIVLVCKEDDLEQRHYRELRAMSNVNIAAVRNPNSNPGAYILSILTKALNSKERLLILELPPMEPIDYEELRERYQLQSQLLEKFA